ncbi:MAG: NAD(P)/FAD-dependent oxidoreductase [Planctomycetaceae bacterium]|nr:NAD(P)/FAD-dependent oxidoreductase [Planctomycetaceae bacterium]
MTVSSQPSPRVVVIGGGFGGINVAKRLNRAPVSVVLIDRRNYHLFQPLLYQVATAELEPSNIAAPIRQILSKQSNVDVALGEITGVDLEKKVVLFDGGECRYDYLVIATGMRQSYFGHDEFRAAAPGLKSIDDALEIRRRVLLAFEEAEWEADEQARKAKLTFVVVGGGPTGVELAGAIMDVAAETLRKEFRQIKPKTARVIIVDGGKRLVAAMPADLGHQAQHVLERMGVEIRLESRVTNVDSKGVDLEDERIDAENVFWAAGVQGQSFAKTLGVELDRAGRIVVGPDLSIPNHPEVFVVGDAALAPDAKTGNPVPGLAQGAIQTGRFVAKIIRQEVTSTSRPKRPDFSYYNKGSMAMIGRGNAVAAIGDRHFSGFIGWLAWLLVHVMFLIGFGNKLLVMTEWFWNFVLGRRRAWLITSDPPVEIKTLRRPTIKLDDS